METTHVKSFVGKGSKEVELYWARNGVKRRLENRNFKTGRINGNFVGKGERSIREEKLDNN